MQVAKMIRFKQNLYNIQKHVCFKHKHDYMITKMIRFGYDQNNINSSQFCSLLPGLLNGRNLLSIKGVLATCGVIFVD